MQLQIVSSNQAEILKQLGFSWETTAYYKKKYPGSKWFLVEQDASKHVKKLWNHNSSDFSSERISAPTVVLALRYCLKVYSMWAAFYPGWTVRVDFLEQVTILENGVQFFNHVHVEKEEDNEFFDSLEEAEVAALDWMLQHLSEKYLSNNLTVK